MALGSAGGASQECVWCLWRALLPGWSLTRPPLQAGGNPFANMGGLMDNIKKAQAMVQVEAAKVQEELAR